MPTKTSKTKIARARHVIDLNATDCMMFFRAARKWGAVASDDGFDKITGEKGVEGMSYKLVDLLTAQMRAMSLAWLKQGIATGKFEDELPPPELQRNAPFSATEFLTRHLHMSCIDRLVAAAPSAAPDKFQLPAHVLGGLKELDWPKWTPKHDAMLVLGVYSFGWGSWDDIRKKSAYLVGAVSQKDRGEKKTFRGKPFPRVQSLRARVSEIVGVIVTHDAASFDIPRFADAPPVSRKRGRAGKGDAGSDSEDDAYDAAALAAARAVLSARPSYGRLAVVATRSSLPGNVRSGKMRKYLNELGSVVAGEGVGDDAWWHALAKQAHRSSATIKVFAGNVMRSYVEGTLVDEAFDQDSDTLLETKVEVAEVKK